MEMIDSSGVPSPKANQPPGTLSQRVTYWESAGGSLRQVAVVHRYLRPDGSLGASGLPDPKRVFYDGIVYAAHQSGRHRR
jgi:hypothetical protein